jgi:hypothetical protein
MRVFAFGELKIFGEANSWSVSRQYPCICLQEKRKNTNILVNTIDISVEI